MSPKYIRIGGTDSDPNLQTCSTGGEDFFDEGNCQEEEGGGGNVARDKETLVEKDDSGVQGDIQPKKRIQQPKKNWGGGNFGRSKTRRNHNVKAVQ